jgi:hypothetical protein
MYSRRDFGRLAIGSLPGLLIARGTAAAPTQASTPGSRWAGVQVGRRVPYDIGGRLLPDDDILAACVALGVSAVELGAQSIETMLGAPVLPASARPGPAKGIEQGLIPLVEEVLQESFELARKTYKAQLARWRGAADLARLAPLRRQFDDAGVRIEIVRWDDLAAFTDDEVDYAFCVSKALGARALSTDLSGSGPRVLAPAAGRHEMFVGFHGGEGTGAAEFQTAFAAGAFIDANLDIGHWVAGNHGDPVPFIRDHARITHIHVTDRKAKHGRQMPFGEGDTPIRQVLQAMRDNRWPFQATVESEYAVPDGSDRMKEVARALGFCRACLVG